MYVYSSYIGNYFLFLLNACYTNPVKIYFKDHERSIKGIKEYPWKEKIYLNPVILQRKWIDHKLRDRFISSVDYDNVLPVELTYTFVNKAGTGVDLSIRTIDKNYRNVLFQLLDEDGSPVFESRLARLLVNREHEIRVSADVPGKYRIVLSFEDRCFRKTQILFYNKKFTVEIEEKNSDSYKRFIELIEKKHVHSLFCCSCGSEFFPIEAEMTGDFLRKNYIPIKEYLDIEKHGMDYITEFIMRMNNPSHFKRGLVHLLNMLRLASVEDELTIVTSLYKDDPSFAHFITDKLFLFEMIPIMEDRELQRILNRIDDDLLARALSGESAPVRSKIMRNISRRRQERISVEMKAAMKAEEREQARMEIHRRIRSYFEERFGRELKIPSSSRVTYRVPQLINVFEKNASEYLTYHTGSHLVWVGPDVYEVSIKGGSTTSETGPDETVGHVSSRMQGLFQCLQYDSESSGDKIFDVIGLSESTVYLMSRSGLRHALIHIYDWTTSLEDTESYENIPRRTVVPLQLSSSGVVLTVGAIDGKGKPLEQVTRLKTKEGLAL